MRLFPVFQSVVLAGLPLALSLLSVSAQETIKPIKLGPADLASAASATPSAFHALGLSNVNRRALWASGKSASVNPAASTIPTIPPPGFYPGDLANPGNGTTVQSAHSHGIYVNCLPNCWGTPANFLNDLNHSDMIHITDAYVASFTNNRYPNGTGGLLSGSLPHILYDADILAIAHAGASAFGSGYQNIYHLYLPPGQDVCFTGSTVCYAPDNPNNFYFCAYHGSVDFTDIGHVLFTVEPYQNVGGCQVQAPSPNGLLVDSTADVLSHELFETITDPDGSAWWNKLDLDLFGAEIGDECQNFNFGYGSVSLNGKKYEIQPEYSNLLHGCAVTPRSID